jgi:dienelactone hydrolase
LFLAVLAWFLVPSWCPGGDLAFRRHVLNADSEFVAAAVCDVNRDGKLDIVCGGYWYEAPTWKKHFLRNVEILGGRPDGYAHLPFDLNGDGWTDLVTVNWRSNSIKWIAHPGAGLAEGKEWKATVIAVPGPSETGRLVDVDGDGLLDILPNGAGFAAWWAFRPEAKPQGGWTPAWVRHELPRELAAHGLGFGDINGDGRGDVVGRFGWAEAPSNRRTGRWRWHADFDLDPASIPILVVDVDGDGDNDLVWCRAHHYGVYWLEQVGRKDDQIRWLKHVIDTSWAGGHAPLWEDLDGDGQKELIVGKRYLAHEGRDPGEYDPMVAYRYEFDRQTRTWKRWLISHNEGVGFGLDPKAVDLDGDGDLDLVCGGRHGLYWFENLGRPGTAATAGASEPGRFPVYGDRLKLLVVKDGAGSDQPVQSPFDWGQRRLHILAAVESVLGPLPEPHRRVPLDVRVLSETATESYVRKKITYAADPDDRVPAYLLLPKPPRSRGPALLCLPDAAPVGKDEPAGLGGRDSLHYAQELAQRGYVCLVPDYPSFGDYAYDFNTKGGAYASGSMKAVWNHIRGLDLLEALPEVNVNRMGCIGHGLGGQSALLTAAFDYRVAAVVSSCGFTTFPRYKGGDLTDWADARLLPRLRAVYHQDPARIPFDFAELLATLAPRPVFVSAPLRDRARDVEGVKQALAAASAVYKFRRVEGSLRAVHPDTDTDFPKEVRTGAYAWLDRLLRP